MLVRSKVVRDVKDVKLEAPAVRERDAAYQAHVLQQWVKIMIVNPLGDAQATENENQNV